MARTSRQICVGDRMLAGVIVDDKLMAGLKVQSDERKAACAPVLLSNKTSKQRRACPKAKKESRFPMDEGRKAADETER